jgi:MFS family permease
MRWTRFLPVLTDRAFRLFWLASFTSKMGSRLVTIAIVFAVLQLTGSATALGLVLGAGSVTQLMFLLIGGVWADRLPRRLVMVGADLVRMAVQATVAFLLVTGRAHVWELLAGNIAVSAATSFFDPASKGLVAETVSAERLQDANGLLAVSDSTVSFAGLAISGFMVAALGPGWSFAVDAATFAASAALVMAMPPVSGRAANRQRFLADLAEGWHELTARRWYWLNLITHALWNLAFAAFFVLGPVIARQRLDGAIGWGLTTAALSAGVLAGGLAVMRIRPRHPLVTGNLALTLGSLLMLALAGGLPLYAVMLGAVLAFAGMAVLNGLWETTVQQLIPAHVLSRVISYDFLISLAMAPLGLVAAGPLSAVAGYGPVLIGAALLMVVPNALICLTPGIRKIVRHEDGIITGPPARPPEGSEPAQGTAHSPHTVAVPDAD